ncbi:TniQ family protein [Shewanella indica]|uniref:TniQ family protein n=1 Tax=Shewanella indica TaxID=768528 RepID=UPI003AAD1846
MFVKPLPGEHIYSYLYRAYKLHSVNALHTIINSEGLFKQRLALIKYEYIKDFVPLSRNDDSLWWNQMLAPVVASSDFYMFELNTPAVNEGGGKVQSFGWRLRPLRRRRPDRIKFCPDCIEEFITEFGTAYLLSEWLGDAVICQEHSRRLVFANCRSRKEADGALSEIFQAQGNGFDERSTPTVE